MFINPKIAIDEGWISGIADVDKQLQPNAIDFTLDVVHEINVYNIFTISEGGKEMKGTSPFEPIKSRSDDQLFWFLRHSNVYDGMSDVYVNIPDGVAAMLITRSVFSRNGVFLTSGLYDSGFKGHIGFAIHVRQGDARVYTGTRIGQVIFVESENASQYVGGWNHKEGTHYTEKGNGNNKG